MAPLRLGADRRQRLPEFACGLVAASEPVEHLGARRVEEVMFGEAFGVDRIERRKAGVEALCKSDRDGVIEGDDGARVDARQHAVQLAIWSQSVSRHVPAALCVEAIAACSW